MASPIRPMIVLAVALFTLQVADGRSRVTDHPAQAPRVLNNFVTEVLRVDDLKGDGTHVFSIDNPRRGWLFFRTNGVAGIGSRLDLQIQPEGKAAESRADLVIEYGRGQRATVEKMRFLDKGNYTLQLHMEDAEVVGGIGENH